MEAINTKTLAQIVSTEPATAMVFEKYGLDFCCKGKRTIEEACSTEHLNPEEVKEDLENILKNKKPVPGEDHFDKMELDKLVDHILHKHHEYVKDMLPVLHRHTQKVAAVHGERHPEVIEIAKLFNELRIDFEQHMFKEEEALFPYIKMLVHAKMENDHHSFDKRHFVANPISVMVAEHDRAGEMMTQIHKLSNNFNPPDNACTTYKLSFAELNAFEKNLHQHVHLENNILFPKAIALENILNKISEN